MLIGHESLSEASTEILNDDYDIAVSDNELEVDSTFQANISG
jgi:hypothetical protein